MDKLNLTAKQINFFEQHEIPLNKIFDAKNYKTNQWKKIVLENEFWVAINTTPCRLKGHTMRTSGGACIECKPDVIRFVKRYYANAYFYVAGSIEEKVLKVGCANNIKKRETTLNEQGYGGISDWKTLYYVKVENSGKIEFEIHTLLKKYLLPRTFVKNDKENISREIFKCNYEIVSQTINNIFNNNNNIHLIEQWTNNDVIENYNFE